jgi:hypothetical protein
MKKPIVAFTLSFFLPGAGLAYLGKWKWAFINLGVVLLIGVAAALLLSEETFQQYGQYIGVACASASGALADILTKQMNQKSKKMTPHNNNPAAKLGGPSSSQFTRRAGQVSGSHSVRGFRQMGTRNHADWIASRMPRMNTATQFVQHVTRSQFVEISSYQPENELRNDSEALGVEDVDADSNSRRNKCIRFA